MTFFISTNINFLPFTKGTAYTVANKHTNKQKLGLILMELPVYCGRQTLSNKMPSFNSRFLKVLKRQGVEKLSSGSNMLFKM